MASDPSTRPLPLDLEGLDVLVVDCQTTGATPRRGHLLELAWARLEGIDAAPPPIHVACTSLPDGETVPPRIAALTGITAADVARAPQPATVWTRLLRDAALAAKAAEVDRAVAVAHFARFERAFLTDLHEKTGRGPFPLDLLCTHEIACRLFPGLPRRGLKALAGRLGHVLGETKRAAAHVEATIGVWRELVARLVHDHRVRTLPGLRAWLETTTPTRRGGRDYAVDRSKRLELPEAPGVYRMLGKGGEVLYLGKATSLRARVNGYFQKRRHTRDRVPEMLTQAFDVDVTETATPLEAALLEADEIKRHAPPYNVQLRDRGATPCFADASLADVSEQADARHPVGPLPPGSTASLGALRALLTGPTDAGTTDVGGTWRRALDLAEDAVLEKRVLADGLALFRARHRPAPGLPAVQVRGLGARLYRAWREALDRRKAETAGAGEAVGTEGDETEAEAPEEEGPREPWSPKTPEAAAGALESVLRHVAYADRRARWLVRLSESCLVWPAPSGGAARRLVLERGRVVRGEDVPLGVPPAPPPGWPRGRLRRLASFDVATYDRLRVLTTELKRLVAGGADVRVALAPRLLLDRDALARRLFWV